MIIPKSQLFTNNYTDYQMSKEIYRKNRELLGPSGKKTWSAKKELEPDYSSFFLSKPPPEISIKCLAKQMPRTIEEQMRERFQ
jgi:hypothetical protein